MWKHYDSTHTRAGTHTYTYTHAHATFVQAPALALSQGSPLCMFICKNLQRGLRSRPLPLFTGLLRERGWSGLGAWHRQHVSSTLHTIPSPVFSTSWIGVNSGQNTALSGALSFLPQSLLTQPSAGCLEEADFHVRTQSVLPARHGPCSKACKTLQNPHKAPHVHLHLAGVSGWVGSGRDPHLNLSCYSACEY